VKGHDAEATKCVACSNSTPVVDLVREEKSIDLTKLLWTAQMILEER